MMEDNNFTRVEKLISEFLKMDNKRKMRDFLLGILTPKELEEIAMRLEIVKLLKRGVRQHVIAERLKTGVATVTRGSRELKSGRFKYTN